MMGLEELTFYVEGVDVCLTSELHKRHDNPEHNPFIGWVPVRVQYHAQYGSRWELRERVGNLRYDIGKQIFITALSDFVPTDSKDVEKLEKYAQGMQEVAHVYSTLLCLTPVLPHKPIITQKHFYRNSGGEWRDLGLSEWLGVYSHEELEKMADEVK